MRVFLTGATGFIGARLLRRLVERGDEVVIFRRPSSDTALIADLLANPAVSDRTGAIESADAVAAAMAGCDAVIHTAGDVSYWRRDRARQQLVNVEGTRNVLVAARAGGVKRLLHTSSVAAVGIPARGAAPADEQSVWNAGDSDIGYFLSKRSAEELVLAAAASGLEAVIVNPGYVIGPGDVRLHDGNIFIDLHRRTIPLCPPGGNCWVDIDDIVTGHLLALERGRSGERYILGGENLPYRQVFEHIGALLGVPVPRFNLNPLIAFFGAPIYELIGLARGRYPRMTREMARLFHEDLYYDSSKAMRELGYGFRPFHETAARTIAWYREHGYLPPAAGGG